MSLYKIFLTNPAQGTKELELPHANWKDNTRNYVRDKKYLGIIIKYSLALDFVKDGASFVKTIYETQGFDADCKIRIYEFNYNLIKYELYYSGQLDFSTYKAFETSIQIDAVQGSEIQNFLNNDDVEINVLNPESLNGTTLPDFTNFFHDLNLHSQILVKRYQSDNVENETATAENIPRTEAIGIQVGYVVFPQLATEEKYNDFESNEIPNYPIGLSNLNPKGVLKYILRAEFGGDYRIQIQQDYTVSIDLTALGTDINLFKSQIIIEFDIISNGDETNIDVPTAFGRIGDVYAETLVNQTIEETSPFPQTKTLTISVNFDQTINIPNDARVYLTARAAFTTTQPTEGEAPIITLNQTKNFIQIDADTKIDGSLSKGIYEHDVMARLCDQILNKTGSFRSDFLGRLDSYGRSYIEQGAESSTMLTNGSYLKGNGDGNGSMKFKVSELFENMNAKYNLGIGFEENPQTKSLLIRMEPKEYFYSNNEIINIGCVTDLEKTIDQELVYNSVRLGHKDEDPKDARIDSDFTSPQTRKVPLNAIKNELNIVSQYVAQGSTIEETRRNFIYPLEKQDESKNDDIFMITTYKDTNTDEIRSISGVENFNSSEDAQMKITSYTSAKNLDTAYNLYLLPVYLYQKYWAKDVKSIFQKQISTGSQYSDRFLSGINLTDVEIIKDSVSYKSDANYQINEYKKPIWLPEIYNFEKELTANDLKVITKDQKGFIRFQDRRGNEKKGFLIELSIKDDSRIKKCSFTLLRKNDAI